jgi:hypothetical protein
MLGVINLIHTYYDAVPVGNLHNLATYSITITLRTWADGYSLFFFIFDLSNQFQT